LTALLGASAYLLLVTPEPGRTARRLAASLCDETPEGLALAAAPHLAEVIDLALDGAPTRATRADALGMAMGWRRAHAGCSSSLTQLGLEPADGDAVWVAGTLVLSSSQPGDVHAELRSVRALFRPADKRPRLVRLVLSAPLQALPEARP
jgi:hypothetical protein